MPRIRVLADDGWIALDELALASHLEGDHARRCLADRVSWAVEEAEARAHGRQPPAVSHAVESDERELQLIASG